MSVAASLPARLLLQRLLMLLPWLLLLLNLLLDLLLVLLMLLLDLQLLLLLVLVVLGAEELADRVDLLLDRVADRKIRQRVVVVLAVGLRIGHGLVVLAVLQREGLVELLYEIPAARQAATTSAQNYA